MAQEKRVSEECVGKEDAPPRPDGLAQAVRLLLRWVEERLRGGGES